MDFTFVNDARIQKILERDYKELQSLNPQTATKSVIVLAGGIYNIMATATLTYKNNGISPINIKTN